ncbi:MAG: DUF3999 domain-containing protein [bacterium]|nr:DUF3999 domain-containing protein [bacterium]
MSFRTIVLGLCLVTLAAPAAALEGYRYSRPIEVTEPGWVGVHLDGNALAHAATDLELFAPNGEEAPFRLLTPSEEGSRRPVRVLEVTERPDGWTLVMDLGLRTPRHTRLWFEFEQQVRAPGCRLEGSDDLVGWSPLVVADLFRLGEARDFQQMVLDYPPSDHRYLRLTWPRMAGLPELHRVEVATLDGHIRWQPVTVRGCEPYAPTAILCRLSVPRPASSLRRLDLEFKSSGRTGLRLAIGEAGRFRVLGEVILQAGAGSVRMPFRPTPEQAHAEALRLELYASGPAPPVLREATVLVASRSLLFEAREAGSYTLAYGRPTPLARTPEAAASLPKRIAWLKPGDEIVAAWPAIPEALAAPAVAMPGELKRSWELAGEGAEPGSVVRLDLPEEVYAAVRPDLGDLRLAVAGKQLPYVRWSPPEPERVWRRGVMDSELLDGGRSSRIELELTTGLPYTELWFSAPVAPFERSLGGRHRRPAQPGLSERWHRAFPTIHWRCVDTLPLPCRVATELGSVPEPQLVVDVDNGDNPPLPGIDFELWRRRDVLLFVWPAAGPVTLEAGRENLRSPRYDLATLRDLLLLRDWRKMEIGAGAEEPAPAVEWGRWALTAAVVLAAGVLLLLLARLLRSQES